MSEYKRLTGKSIGSFQYCLKNHKPKVGEFNDYDTFFDYSMAIKRLGEIEDKIDNGTLMELPCKVGDTVYCIYHFYDVEEDFEYDIIPEEVVDIIVQEDDFDIGTACRMIGKFKRVCVCLTKAEAEAKLKELREKEK